MRVLKLDEAYSVDPINLKAIEALESFGNCAPTEDQILTMESYIRASYNRGVNSDDNYLEPIVHKGMIH